jgi:LAGLIDADG endonuclease
MLLRVHRRPSEDEGRARGSTSLSLSLNERDRRLLEDLRTFFGCGWIRESRSDRTFKFEVRSVPELLDRIVPHFEAHPLRGAKRRSFEGFARVCQVIEQGGHLRPEGMAEIVRTACEMNLGKRRHSVEQLLRMLSEVKG